MGKKTILILLLVLLCCLALAGAALAYDPAGHRIQRWVMSSAGGPSGSAHYTLNATVGQSSAVGVSQSSHFRLSAGFWSPAAPAWVQRSYFPLVLKRRR
jgi:hypothetical protein